MTDILPVNPLLVAALYYLLARAEITRFLWSKYPPRLDRLAMCPACLGFWLGCACGAARVVAGVPLPTSPYLYVAHAGLVSLVSTPILFGLMRLGFDGGTQAPEVPTESNDAKGP